MKIEEHKIEKKFEPITFTVTLESKEELAVWYARFNCAWEHIDGALPDEVSKQEVTYEDGRKASIYGYLADKWEELYDN